VTISPEELQLAARNHGMPLEALRYDVTPVGMHYLLVHYDVPVVDAREWRLEVGGAVQRPLRLSLDDLRLRHTETHAVTMECAGNGRALLDPRPVSQPWLREAVGTGEWTGTPLAALLEDAGIVPGAREVLFTGLDHGVEGGGPQTYERSLPLADATRPELLLAWGLNGGLLPPQHGFPLRLIVPGWYGMASVKWLTRITVLEQPFEGYQNTHAYRLKASEDDPGVAVTRMMPRALLAPPGVPEFMSRRRFLPAGPVELEGRAWSGWAPIESVDVSTDGGATWAPAELEPPAGEHAWTRFTFTWDAPAGEHELCVRCRDAQGNETPLTPPWNVGGYANNAVHRVLTTVQ
jgi:DMSO/TMAO reductase YedYZ molybdopterin-dependent catalytic subunit